MPSRSFKASKNSTVEVTNRYGDINIETWDKDSVSVEIRVMVTEKTMGKLHDKLRSINFNMTQSGQFIIIGTIVGGNNNMLISEFNRLKENIGVGDARVEINMKIRMPDNLTLRINNKFGNIYLNDYSGEVNLDLSNGRLIAQSLKGFSNLKVGFGDAVIHSLDVANIELSFGKLNLTNGKQIRMTTKTSDVSINEAVQLNLNSSRDTYRIRMVDDLDADANWTDFNIAELRKKGSFRMSYGYFLLEKMMPSFERLYIDSRSTKITMFLDAQNDLAFDIVSNKEVRLPMDAVTDSKQ